MTRKWLERDSSLGEHHRGKKGDWVWSPLNHTDADRSSHSLCKHARCVDGTAATQFLQSTWKAAIPGQPANPRGQPTNGGQHGGGAAATTARCGQFAGGSSTTTAEAAAPAALLRGGQAPPVPTSPAAAPTEENGGTTVDGGNPLGLGSGRKFLLSQYAGQQELVGEMEPDHRT